MRRAQSPRLFLTLATLALILLLGTSSSMASELSLHFEPVIGWEKVDATFAPTRTLYRGLYGLRAVGGYHRVAIEGAYVRGTLLDRVPSQDYASDETSEALKAGLRYVHPLASFLSLQAVGGCEIRRSETTETQATVTLTASTPWTGRPYVGVGAALTPVRFIGATAQINATFEDPTNLLRKVTPSLTFGVELHPF